jgi:hypothetical protein
MEQSNKLCKCGKVGEISCPNDERCGTANTQLPAEVIAQIDKDAEHYANVQWSEKAKHIGHHLTDKWDNAKDDYEAGATEWAQWKVAYNELLASVDEKIDKALHAERNRMQVNVTASEVAWAKECQELKERAERMEKEHSDLNLALAAMLNGYQNLSAYQRDWFTVPKDLIDCYTKMVLEYDATNPKK